MRMRAICILLGLAAALAAQTAVETGAQLYRGNCITCHGQDGDAVPGVDFRKGAFRRASTDDDLARVIGEGIPGTAMPPSNLPEASRRALAAYIRSMRSTGAATTMAGDIGRGRAVFEGKGDCIRCHRVRAKGSHLGPDLTDIGAIRNAARLGRSILDPSETILPQHRIVRAVTKQGATVTGRRLNEDTDTIQLIDDRERLVSLAKSDLRELTVLKASPMPSYQGKLSSQELADLVAYLLSLKGTEAQ
jgi:putative heme-binding domain-containing protein